MPICSCLQDYMINWILNTTVQRQKLNLGLAFYGISLNLSDPHNTQLGAPISGGATGGELLNERGMMAYYEVLEPVPFTSNLYKSHIAIALRSNLFPGGFPCVTTSNVAIPLLLRAQELCESRGGRPGLPVPDNLYGLCGCKETMNLNLYPPVSFLVVSPASV